MRILLDSDMLLFRAASATEVEIKLDDDVWTRHSELPAAREMYWQQVESWCDQFGCSYNDVWHCFTDASAFRRELFPDYKAKRKAEQKAPRKLQVGHILYTSWGYDQTNVDYYQVTALKGETMVIVQKLEQSCPETGFMSGKALPAEKLIGKPIACRATGDRITVD